MTPETAGPGDRAPGFPCQYSEPRGGAPKKKPRQRLAPAGPYLPKTRTYQAVTVSTFSRQIRRGQVLLNRGLRNQGREPRP
jgi:hypothetical protein